MPSKAFGLAQPRQTCERRLANAEADANSDFCRDNYFPERRLDAVTPPNPLNRGVGLFVRKLTGYFPMLCGTVTVTVCGLDILPDASLAWMVMV